MYDQHDSKESYLFEGLQLMLDICDAFFDLSFLLGIDVICREDAIQLVHQGSNSAQLIWTHLLGKA